MQVALITGAASGLGWELAQAYRALGYGLVLSDINAQGLAARVESLDSPDVIGISGDLTEAQLQTTLISTCEAHFGRLDLLINNAGITHRSPTLRTDPAVFHRVMAVDYHAPLELTLKAIPLLHVSRGQIIAIGSMAGWMPVLGRAGYCAAKSALAQCFEVLRGEVQRKGIDLLLVYPSFLDTPIQQHALGADGRSAGHKRSTIGKVRSAKWMAASIVRAHARGCERLFPDRGSWLASLLWRLAPGFYYRKMSERFAAEMD